MPHTYNNFVYRINLPEPTAEGTFAASSQPLTTIPKVGITSIIFRLSNPHAQGINNTNRVENEVASLHLAQTALTQEIPKYASIIPAVYDWKRLGVTTASSATEPEFGWIMMELLPGVILETKWADISLAEKKVLLNEIAMVFAAIQRCPLPNGVDAHGGLAIRDKEIVSGQASTMIGGPWQSYADWWRARFHDNLCQAEKSSVVKGWNENGIRARLNKFMADGIERSITAVDKYKLVLVHGDFCKCFRAWWSLYVTSEQLKSL